MFFHYTGHTIYINDEEILGTILNKDFNILNYDMRGTTCIDNDIRDLENKTFNKLYNQFAETKVKIYITP